MKKPLKLDEIEKKLEEVSVSVEKEKKLKRLSTIIMIALLVFSFFISLDIILVKKAGIGPFLAIPIKTYNDGGTKEYYGFFYKVIKYNEEKGRQDTVLGSWGLKYDVTPIKITQEELAFDFRNEKDAYQEYYGEFLEVTGTVSQVDKNNKTITLRYNDIEGDAYTLDIIFKMKEEEKVIEKYKHNDIISVVGTLTTFSPKTDNKSRSLILENGFIS